MRDRTNEKGTAPVTPESDGALADQELESVAGGTSSSVGKPFRFAEDRFRPEEDAEFIGPFQVGGI